MKLKLTWLMTLFMAFAIQFSYAQEKTVTGTVTAASDGMPLPGASVIVKGTTRGVQTDFDGGYSIDVNVGEVLVFSYVGMETSEVTVGASNTYDVAMNEDIGVLDEVVVTAYGTQKKESVAGSIGEIKSEEVAEITAGNVMQGTVGKVAGVQVFNNSGMPGDAPTIRMRGIGSINASAAPLYVVDGVPFSGDVASINSQDIESMTFLKDASAAALYGNRGANGVIIITTKKGKAQKLSVTVDSKAGFATRAVEEYDIMTGSKEYYERYFQSLKNNYMFNSNMSATDAANAAAAELIDGVFGLSYNVYDVPNDQLIDPVTGELNPNANRYDTGDDWDDYLFGNGFFTSTFVSVSGGNEKSSQYLSVGYDRNDGYVVNSGLEKITTRLKSDAQITDFLKVGGNISYSHLVQNYLDGYTGGSNYSSPFYWVRNVAPIYPVLLYDENGNPVYGFDGSQLYDDGTGNGGEAGIPIRPFGALQHPYATAINDVKKYTTDNLYASGFAELKLAEGLKFTYVATGELFSYGDRSMDTPLYGDAVEAGGRVDYSSSRRLSFTQQQLLNYNKSFGSHNFDLLLGHETLDRRTDIVAAGRSKLLFPSAYVDHAAVIQTASGYGTSYALEGYFSRLNYDYDGKYFVNASIRRDGSSRFHPDNRWGTFFGVGAAWMVSRESFMENVDWINALRLKASYGEQGNDNLGIELPYLSQYYVTPTTDASIDVPSYTQVTLGNKDITWETNANFNAGFDITMFDNRLNIEAEYFERKVSDMLFQKPLPISSGFSSIPENVGDMENIGFEATISADIVRNEDFTFSVGVNATHYKNEITKLPYNGNENNNIVSGIYIREEGGSVYDFYMREFAGVNPVNGAALFYMDDPNNEGERILTEDYAEADLYRIDKSAIPDLYGGFNFDFQYKGFDLGLQFAYQFGGYSYDSVWMSSMAPGRGENYHRDVNDTWTIDNTTASLPRVDVDDPNNYYATSTLGLIESDYLSLQNVSLGYTFNDKITKSLGVDSLRFYALADNVYLWSKRQGFDPRMGGVTGTSDNNYSILRTVSFGVNVKF